MTIYSDDGQAVLHHGDVREVLRELPAESVQCVVTSPPYWSLRDYGVEPSVWGGEADCQHEWSSERVVRQNRTGLGLATLGERYSGGGHKAGSIPEQCFESGNCALCGAWKGALGLEPTSELFVEHMVEVFREVRRVLAKDGTLWLNIGDSYAGSWGEQGRTGSMAERSVISSRQIGEHPQFETRTGARGLGGDIKEKDLVGIPWMLAFALRADGWGLRQDLIWHKTNPMPESVTDRCTKAHEYLFLLTKSKRYFYDAGAIREPASSNTHARMRKERAHDGQKSAPAGERNGMRAPGVGPKDVPMGLGIRSNESFHAATTATLDNRNKRSVWSIPTAPFSEAHFATFPPDLVEPCILAGSRPGDTVLDPFLGSGTTAMVAKRLGRRAVGIDLNPEYLAMAVKRIGGQLSMELAR